MNYHRLGRSGLRVSPLCLGAMMFGDQTDEAASREIIASARDAGVNFIDTSDAYAAGRSEQIVGAAVKADRDRWVIATKVGFLPDAMAPAGPNLSRKHMMRCVERSLTRLGTDYIDLWYLHRDDLDTPLEETVHALADLVRQGRIRYFGVSNFTAWRLAEVVRLCDAAGIDRPAACQPLYNAMNRMAESELLPACAYYGVGVVPYSPLARGVLTAKYASLEQPLPGTRAARRDPRIHAIEWRSESIAHAKVIAAHAHSRGSTAAHFALKWVLNSSAVHSVICGPRTLDQWKDYLAALAEPAFTAEDEALVDHLVAPGYPSRLGFVDPNTPVTGRRPRVPAAR